MSFAGKYDILRPQAPADVQPLRDMMNAWLANPGQGRGFQTGPQTFNVRGPNPMGPNQNGQNYGGPVTGIFGGQPGGATGGTPMGGLPPAAGGAPNTPPPNIGIQAPPVPSTGGGTPGLAMSPAPMMQAPPTGAGMNDFIRSMVGGLRGAPAPALPAVSTGGANPYSGYTPGGSSAANAQIMDRIPQGGADTWTPAQWQQAYQESLSNPYLANTVSAQGIQKLYNDYVSKGQMPDRNTIGLWMGGMWQSPGAPQPGMSPGGSAPTPPQTGGFTPGDQVSPRLLGGGASTNTGVAPTPGTPPGGSTLQFPPFQPQFPDGSTWDPAQVEQDLLNAGWTQNPDGTWNAPNGAPGGGGPVAPGGPTGMGSGPLFTERPPYSYGGDADFSGIFSNLNTIGRSELDPLANVQSVDQLGGANSAFFQNMMAQLSPAFAQRRAEGLAAAKESAGNLTGSGFANLLGGSINRSLGEEQATLANYASQGMQSELGRQMGLAQMGLDRTINQGNLDQSANIFNATSANQGNQFNAGQFQQMLLSMLTGGLGTPQPTYQPGFLDYLGQAGANIPFLFGPR